jgi:hypothetical protein
MSCAFCGRGRDDTRYLLAGPGVSICEVCVANCIDVIADAERAKSDVPPSRRSVLRHLTSALKKEPSAAEMRCGLCRSPVTVAASIPVARRGRLCQDCIAAVQEAISRERRESEK